MRVCTYVCVCAGGCSRSCVISVRVVRKALCATRRWMLTRLDMLAYYGIYGPDVVSAMDVVYAHRSHFDGQGRTRR